jgi:orotate phosphoribosyltransferase
MPDLSAAAFLELASGRPGHFGMESGLHSALWLDLDGVFAAPARLNPFVAALADTLRSYRLDVVCGSLRGGAFLAQGLAHELGTEFWYTEPVAPDGHGLFRARYRLPAAFRNRLNRPRVALVDDVMSAGSSLRATHAEVHGVTNVVAVGTLLQLGAIGAAYFKSIGLPVHAVAQQSFDMWAPADCPQCAAGVPIERVA